MPSGVQPGKAQVMPTPFLHDEGEEAWDVKIHVGAGSVYLQGYINIDVEGRLAASMHMSQVMANVTTIDNYYKGRPGSSDKLPPRRNAIVDVRADFTRLNYQPNTVDKIVSIQSLEHLNPPDLPRTLTHWWNILRDKAPLIISVPDCNETLDLMESNPKFAIRHLRGSLRDGYSSHLSWFTKATLVELLEDYGFTVEILPNMHFYPAVVVRAKKDDGYYRGREYQYLANWRPHATWDVLDVGPGQFPFSGATDWLDKVDRSKDFDLPGTVHDLNDLPLPFKDNQWDYVYASHVVEHTNDPIATIKELQRISKRVFIECPTVMVDFAFQHGETHQKWQVLGASDDRILVFVQRRAKYLDTFLNHAYSSLSWNILQSGDAELDQREIAIRRWYWKNQRKLNIGFSWDHSNPIKIIVIDWEGKVREWSK